MPSTDQVLRFVRPRDIYLLILLTVGHCVMLHAQFTYRIALNDRCLRGHEVRSSIVNHRSSDCFLTCLEHCLCVAFQIVDEIACQLLSTTRLITPSSLVESPGCLYYDVIPEDTSTQPTSCQAGWSCCHHANPCLNGWTCEPVASTNFTKLFQCKCLPYYSGNICQDYFPKSCRGYMNGSRVPGKYKVFDDNMNPFEVFCDFDTNSTMAWTLIQSYQLQNNGQFKKYSFAKNHPVHEDTPVWDSYRLSRCRMQSIQEDSSKWRMTCQYDSDGLNYTDYVRGSNDKIDILTYAEKDKCEEVGYIDIRGYECTGCTTNVYQTNKVIFRIDSYWSSSGCSFKAKNSFSCSSAGEDNFGWYFCKNPSHRCSSSPISTSQTWFGY